MRTPWGRFRAGLRRGAATLDEDGLAGAVVPVRGSGLEDGQLALQALDLGREGVAGGALPPGGEGAGGPDQAGRSEHDGDNGQHELAGEAVAGSAHSSIGSVGGFDEVAFDLLNGARQVGLSSTQCGVDLLAIVGSVERADLVAQLGKADADGGEGLTNRGG